MKIKHFKEFAIKQGSTLASNIHKFFTLSELTIKQFADEVGVDPRTISNILRAHKLKLVYTPTLPVICALAKRLELKDERELYKDGLNFIVQ